MQLPKEDNLNTERQSKSLDERAIDFIDDMFDRQLAKGDDEFYGAFKQTKVNDKNRQATERPIRKHRRGI